MMTTSASSLSAIARATVAPTAPAPPTTVTFLFMMPLLLSLQRHTATLRHKGHKDHEDHNLLCDPGVLRGLRAGASRRGTSHKLEITASANCDVLSSVAPSIWRARS